MVLTLGVSLELLAVEVDLAQFAGAIAFRLIVEVRRRRMAALAAGRHRPGTHAFAEFDHGDEAVAAGAIPLFGARVGARGERSQRSPLPVGEADGDAGPRVVEWLDD